MALLVLKNLIAAVRHVGILKFEILSAVTVNRVSVRHHAKFRGDRSNHC